MAGHGSGHVHPGGHGGAGGFAPSGWAVLDAAVVLLLVAAGVAYGMGLARARGRGPWPAGRAVAWYAGLVCAGGALVGPLAAAARTGFTAHMAGHVLLGMLAPLLLVLGAPVTVALRALPVGGARRLARALRARPVRVLAHPVTAAMLHGGGLWLLYATGLYAAMHASVPVHAAVHAHVLAAGYLFTAALVGVDPDPHRASVRVRAAVLVAFVAAHSVLAKRLYAHPPAGVAGDDARQGAQLMYYAGDAVDVTLMVLLLAGWYAATRPRDAARTGAVPWREAA
ncbi:cytochrome c oxidase assembly protein [Puerhibacterium sp. TATVAM-FAB25]|uniref:cytochrome c oxidase assembly protein n=1 Tax=Puerhibacterium sp. TATVAM-FAB25 TaxID=3093699 RepID=UPI00397A6A54